MFLGELGSTDQEVVLAWDLVCVLVGEVEKLVSSLEVDIQSLGIGCMSLIKLDSHRLQLPLQSVDALLVWPEVKKSDLGDMALLSKTLDDTLGNVACTVDYYELHHNLLLFMI